MIMVGAVFSFKNILRPQRLFDFIFMFLAIIPSSHIARSNFIPPF